VVLIEPQLRPSRQPGPAARRGPARPPFPPLPPLPPEPPRRRRSLKKRVQDVISLCLWYLIAIPTALVNKVRERRQARPARPPRPQARAHALRQARPQARRQARPQARRQARPRPSPRVAPARPLSRVKAALIVPFVVVSALLAVVAVPVLAKPTLEMASRPVAAVFPDRGWGSLDEPSTVFGVDGTTFARLHDGINRRVVPLADIPDVVVNAVIAAEDRRFWSHHGYDPEAVGRAALANARAREVTQGASTITQQLAKQNFVGDAPTFLRKGKELLYSVALEERFTKDQLLERYLNQVYFGGQAYGVAAAAEEFFGVPVAQLTAPQAALLAGMIRAPGTLNPRTAPEAATARRNDVLRAMGAAGFLPAAEVDAAIASPAQVLPARSAPNPEPFVVEAVKREFLANPAFGETVEDRRQLLLTGGLRIETTVHPRLQAAARAATRWVPESLGSAIVAVDPWSGRIFAIHDGGAAATGHFDVATQGSRQPGSTFKPLVAAAALEAGMPESQELVGDGPIELIYKGAPAPWRVDNYDQADFGTIDLREAVVNSVNTAFAQLGVALGPEKITDMAKRVGINVDKALGPPHTRGPSMALGGLTRGVSPLELASAYGSFAAGGAHVAPHVIERVLGPGGQEIYKAQPAPQRVLEPAVNAALVDILRDAVAEGTGTAAALDDWDVIGKTGTSEGSADGWFVGAVPVMSTAVWVGRPDSEKPIPGLTGGGMSAPIWRVFMAEALSDIDPVDFPSGPDRTNVKPLKLPQPTYL
jgi:membrane peptidoglycan carboxypeptidase